MGRAAPPIKVAEVVGEVRVVSERGWLAALRQGVRAGMGKALVVGEGKAARRLRRVATRRIMGAGPVEVRLVRLSPSAAWRLVGMFGLCSRARIGLWKASQ